MLIIYTCHHILILIVRKDPRRVPGRQNLCDYIVRKLRVALNGDEAPGAICSLDITAISRSEIDGILWDGGDDIAVHLEDFLCRGNNTLSVSASMEERWASLLTRVSRPSNSSEPFLFKGTGTTEASQPLSLRVTSQPKARETI